MKNKFICSLKKIALTLSCQSGRKLAGAVLLAGAAIPALCGAQAVSWAHQNGTLQSNGSITIKSQSGGSYSGARNPVGAVAKANQSAVTQPPTVIIQATGGGYSEAIPMFTVNGGPVAPPTCPTGYTEAWNSTSYPVAWKSASYIGPGMITNIAGTRFSFGRYTTPSTGFISIGWLIDGQVYGQPGGTNAEIASFRDMAVGLGSPYYAATLCIK